MTLSRQEVREQEAKRLELALGAAWSAVNGAEHTWGVWADTVRQDVEQRHGVDYREGDDVILGDPEYGRALDVGKDLGEIKRQLAALVDRFGEAGRA